MEVRGSSLPRGVVIEEHVDREALVERRSGPRQGRPAPRRTESADGTFAVYVRGFRADLTRVARDK